MAALATSLSHTLLAFQTVSLTGFLPQQLHVAPELLESGLRLSGSCLEPHDTLSLSLYRHKFPSTTRGGRVGGEWRTIYGCSPRESVSFETGPVSIIYSCAVEISRDKGQGYS